MDESDRPGVISRLAEGCRNRFRRVESKMHRLPLTDELKYEFLEPSHHPLAIRLSKWYVARKLDKDLKISGFEIEGGDIVRDLIAQGDGVLLAPNHSDHADSALMYEFGRGMGSPFYFMATHGIFRGVNRYVLPRIGCFPVDREGTDKRALRKSMEILSEGTTPLVIFPEGEIYRLNDKITPLREGVAAVAGMAARKSSEGRRIWAVPVGIKYRFPRNVDPLPWMNRMMGELEGRFSWREGRGMPLQDRIYRYAAGMLSLKEIETYGEVRSGSVRDRVTAMRDHVLERIEAELGSCASAARGLTVPERVKECRRRILEALETPGNSPERAAKLKRALDELFFVIQLYSYPGDYVMSRPTCERAAEILIKFKQDALGRDLDRARHEVERQAKIFVGEPIDVRQFLAETGAKPEIPGMESATPGAGRTKSSRKGHAALTDHLESRMQDLLDRGNPGRPLPGCDQFV